MERNQKTLWSIAAICMVLVASGVHAQNLINNPDVEEGDGDPLLWFSGNVFVDANDPELTRSWTTDTSHSPSHSLEINDRSAVGIAEWRSGGVPVEGHRAYIMSWWWRQENVSGGDGLGASITVAWFDGLPDEGGNAGGNFLKQDVVFAGANAIPEFTKVTLVLTAPLAAKSVDIRLRSGSGFGVGGAETKCLVRLDDASITLLDTSGENFANNPDMEAGDEEPSLWFSGNVFVGNDDPDLVRVWTMDDFHSPDHALGIVDFSTAGIAEWRSGGIPVTEGLEYIFSWWWLVIEPSGGDGLGASITLAWFAGLPDEAGNASGAFIGQNVITSGAGTIDPFAQSGAVVVAPAGAKSVDIRLRSGSGFSPEGAGTTIQVIIDDVYVGVNEPSAVLEWMLLR